MSHITETPFYKHLISIGACVESFQWVCDNNIRTAREAWEKCGNPSWLIWWAYTDAKKYKKNEIKDLNKIVVNTGCEFLGRFSGEIVQKELFNRANGLEKLLLAIRPDLRPSVLREILRDAKRRGILRSAATASFTMDSMCRNDNPRKETIHLTIKDVVNIPWAEELS